MLDTESVPNLGKLISVINCWIGVMEISFRNMKVRLNIFTTFQHASDQYECFFLDNIEEYGEDSLSSLLTKDPLETCLTNFGLEDFDTT